MSEIKTHKHLSPRFTMEGSRMARSREEKLEYQKQWYLANRERLLVKAKDYRDANTEQVREYQNSLAGTDLAKHYGLKNRYGLTGAQVLAMHAEQLGTCPGCMRFYGFSLGNLAVDHNHDTGEVRCLLCRMCNGHEGAVKKYWPELLDAWWEIVNSNLAALKAAYAAAIAAGEDG